MQSKLTLRLDESLIQVAKAYARDADKSLSQIVADYFTLLAAKKEETASDFDLLPPITQSLFGSVQIEKAVNDDRYTYLMEKHQ
ncbi:MAG: hypothetical protein KJZ86_04895 [Caldilineaceae bacterium]|nr:hypothetical protein [Caldilineaceae bacterium]HRJ42457.1 DUF6364 family protein [Caldilineaceae bacterium]